MSIDVANVGTQQHSYQVNPEAEDKPKKKSKFWKGAQNVGAITAAGAGYMGVKIVGAKVQKKAALSFLNYAQNSPDIISRENAESIFRASGLPQKGINLNDLSSASTSSQAQVEYIDEIADILKSKPGTKSWKDRKLFKKAADAIMERGYNLAAEGKNAFFNPSKKEIAINVDKLGASLPHEMGHAKNFTGKGVGKVLSKMRGLSVLTVPILLVALFRKPKDKREESTTFVGKSLDFVKDNAVVLTAACNAPMVLEEGLASIKGAKMAKGILSPKKLKLMNKMNFKAWGTYAVAAGIAVAGVWAVSKIKDKLCADDTTNEKEVTKTDNVIKDNTESDTRIEDTNLEAVA